MAEARDGTIWAPDHLNPSSSASCSTYSLSLGAAPLRSYRLFSSDNHVLNNPSTLGFCCGVDSFFLALSLSGHPCWSLTLSCPVGLLNLGVGNYNPLTLYVACLQKKNYVDDIAQICYQLEMWPALPLGPQLLCQLCAVLACSGETHY